MSAVGYGVGGTIAYRDSYQFLQKEEQNKQNKMASEAVAMQQTEAYKPLSPAVRGIRGVASTFGGGLQADRPSRNVSIVPNFVEWLRLIGRESLGQFYTLQDAREEGNRVAWVR